MTETIELKFKRTNFLTRWPCTVCGGCTEKVSVLTEAKDTINGGDDIRVCERCLERNDIDGELARHADNLEVYAQELRRLIGHLKVPTIEQWQTEYDRVEQLWLAEDADAAKEERHDEEVTDEVAF
jgi:hypothetical protein